VRARVRAPLTRVQRACRLAQRCDHAYLSHAAPARVHSRVAHARSWPFCAKFAFRTVVVLSLSLTRHACLHTRQMTDDFLEQFGERWRQNTADTPAGDELAGGALMKYQDPAAADKLLQIQRELDETKVVLHKTIDSVLARGEKLDNLVEKSSDLSMASQMFYKQAKKSNSCCGMM
jgi:hypothetical protein